MKRSLIFHELRAHAPFTAGGALAGIVLLLGLIYAQIPRTALAHGFELFHPAHVFLSALVTAAMFRRHGGRGLWRILAIGYLGSVGIGTVSDCLIPYLGEWLLDLPNRGFHLGFIEHAWLVNPLALAGIAVGTWREKSHVSHALHVWISTGASLFHVALALGGPPSVAVLAAIAVFLFLSVWLPCCASDIVFPLLFTPHSDQPIGCCQRH